MSRLALVKPTPKAAQVDATTRSVSVEELMRRVSEGDQLALAELVRRGGELPAVEEQAA